MVGLAVLTFLRRRQQRNREHLERQVNRQEEAREAVPLNPIIPDAPVDGPQVSETL